MTPTARQIAADVLNLGRARLGFAADLIEQLTADTGLSPADRRLLHALVFGVVRRRGTLDALFGPFVNRPAAAVEPRVRDLLQLGAYQLLFLTHVPAHAAVHETVDLARHVGSPMAKGFVNGVLRRVAELVTDEYHDTPAADAVPVDHPPEGPLADGSVYRCLTRAALPDPAADPAGYLASGFSFPRWIADRWLARADFAEGCRLGFWFNAPPPLWLRVNRLKLTRAAYLDKLAAAGLSATPGDNPVSLRLDSSRPVRDLPGYAAGEFAVQDAASVAVGAALAPEPGWRVLDLCAAPGGKATHLAEQMLDRGRVVACDPDIKRLGTVTTLCHRLGLTCVETVHVPADGEPPRLRFDAALVDAPCSNTGVLGRRPEVRGRLKPGELPHLVALQTRLLLAAISRVVPGGVVVYSTCSVEPEENAGVVAAACAAVRGLTVEASAAAVPGRPSDGGYWARLRVPR